VGWNLVLPVETSAATTWAMARFFKDEHYPKLCLNNHFIPRSKHTPSLLQEPVS
jgi:hypothetical protein